MPASIFLSGSVSLSPKNQRPPSIDTSTRSPQRNPTRMPCFTQVLTRQPVGADASGSAARTRPADSSSRSCANTDSALALVCRRALLIQPLDVFRQLAAPPNRSRAHPGGRHLSATPSSLSTFSDLRARFRARRHHRQAVGLLEQPHGRHRRLHGNGVGLDEIDRASAAAAPRESSARPQSRRARRLRPSATSRAALRSTPRRSRRARPPPSAAA